MKATQVIAGSTILLLTFLGFCSMSPGHDFFEQVTTDHEGLRQFLGFFPRSLRSVRTKRIEGAQGEMKVMFASLPKNLAGRISVDVMRYMAHRYFSQKYGWIIQGFEPQKSNASMCDARILRSRGPEYCRRVIEGTLATQGFSFQDAATLLAGVEQLIFDEIESSTEKAYHINDLPVAMKLSKVGLIDVVYSFMVEAMMEGNFSDPKQHVLDKASIDENYPNWQATQLFINDVVTADAAEKKILQASTQKYSFEDTVRLTTRISEEFGPWADYECRNMKKSLSDIDVHGTGRVKLSDFWRIGDGSKDGQPILYESSEYLRTLGALDDSDVSLGPQVIIPNYVYSVANCVMSTPHYSVCCLNTCDGMLQRLESRLLAPEALPEKILMTLADVHSQSRFPAFQQALDGTLLARLQEIAARNGHGLVPIHGRLFAQWLHFVFPRDCPYPHEVGSSKRMTPGEWGELKGFNITANVDHPSMAEESEVKWQAQKPESMLPPSPNAGAKLWVWKEHLLTSSTASDKWTALSLSFGAMLLVAGLLITSIRCSSKAFSSSAESSELLLAC